MYFQINYKERKQPVLYSCYGLDQCSMIPSRGTVFCLLHHILNSYEAYLAHFPTSTTGFSAV